MRQTSRTAHSLLFGAAAIAAAWLGPVGSAAAGGTTMPLGSPTTAPAGFLDFCGRTPAACAEPGVPASQAWSQARQLFWAGVFDTSSSEPASVFSPPAPDRRARRPVDFGSLLPAARRRMSISPRHSSVDPAETSPTAAARPGDKEIGLSLTAKDWDRIDRLNRDINRRIRQASDQRQYGLSDYWAEPTGRAPRGDCEDYVLAKRRALIDLGYPQSAFSIALVVTPWGEDHAVLLMATTQGEVVLDNLAQRIVTWDRADYRWVKRQSPGRSLAWSRIG